MVTKDREVVPGRVPALPESPVRGVSPAQHEGIEERFAASDSRWDLTRLPVIGHWLERALKSRRFQFYIILPSQILFWLVVVAAIFGTVEPEQNFGTTITWFVWFALIFPLTLLVGRAWCVTCPFGGFGEWVQRRTLWQRTRKALGLGWKMPRRLAGYGLVISAVLFLGMTWAEEYFNIAGPGAPIMTAYMILGIISVSTLVSILFERRTFCRYICPLSSLIGAAGSTGVIAGFRSRDRQVCAKCATKDCMRGGENGFGCPWYTYPATADTNAYCGLCSECYKACPNENIGVYAQKPLTSVIAPRKRTDIAWVVAMLFGLVIFQQWNALASYQAVDGWLNGLIGFPNYPNPIDFIGTIAAVVGAFAGFAWLLSRGLSMKDRVARSFTAWFAPLMYGFIPLMGADFLARVLPKFLNNAPKMVASVYSIFGAEAGFADMKLMPADWLLRTQYAIVGLGTIAAVYATWRIAGRDLRKLTPHERLVRVVPGLVILAIGAGLVALYVVMNGAE